MVACTLNNDNRNDSQETEEEPEEKEKKEVDLNSVSSLYVAGEDEIVMDNAGMGHVKEELIIFFTKDATDEQIIEVIESVDGELIGKELKFNEYQIRIEGADLAKLEELASSLLENSCVLDTKLDRIYSITTNLTTTNDPWVEDGDSDFLDWNENNPSGNNWWLEATRVPSAWDYSDYFSTINVGIIDDGLDVDHEDIVGMNIEVLNPELCDDGSGHGTHVTGIMMAEANNGVGIAGVLSNVNGYFVDIYSNEEQQENYVTMVGMLDGVFDCCKNVGPDEKIVINISSGLNNFGIEILQSYLANNTAEDAISTIALMLYYDYQNFIIVQAAGNEGLDASTSNGWFSSVDEEKVANYLENHPSYAAYMTVDDIMGSIMVVAAVDEPSNGSYSLTSFSNYGHTVTLAAPGANIYSTVVANGEGGSYEAYWGTSMAAPLAASITALAWSANQDLKPAELKQLIIDSMTVPVYSVSENDTEGYYYMIDAEAAVEAVLNYSGVEYSHHDNNHDNDYDYGNGGNGEDGSNGEDSGEDLLDSIWDIIFG